MTSKETSRLYNNKTLKKGCKVKLQIRGYDKDFVEVENAYISKARPGEIEDDSITIVVNGQTFDAGWITEIKAK